MSDTDPANARDTPSRKSFAALHHPQYRAYFITTALAMMADNIEHVISYWLLFQKFESTVLGGFAVNGTPERPDVVEVTVNVARTGSRLFAIRERRHNTADGADKQGFFARLGVPVELIANSM